MAYRDVGTYVQRDGFRIRSVHGAEWSYDARKIAQAIRDGRAQRGGRLLDFWRGVRPGGDPAYFLAFDLQVYVMNEMIGGRL